MTAPKELLLKNFSGNIKIPQEDDGILAFEEIDEELPIALRELFDSAYGAILQSDIVGIAVHEKPDGDAIGSMLAVAHVAETICRKQVILYSRDPVPETLRFLPSAERVQSSLFWYPDLWVGLDYGNVRRLGIPSEYLEGARMITFDHHPMDAQRGDVRIVDTSCSSTAELVYLFMRHHGLPVTREIATCLFTGIYTDSGGFVHANTSQRTLRIAGHLLRKNVSSQEVRNNTLSIQSQDIGNAWGRILGNIQHDKNMGMIYAGLPFFHFQELGLSIDDFSGFVEILNAVDETKFCAFLVEYEEGRVKGSLRSDPFRGVDVSAIAKRLGGGGHMYAAAFEFEGSLAEAENYFKQETARHFGVQ